jgi:hypothetical protein
MHLCDHQYNLINIRHFPYGDHIVCTFFKHSGRKRDCTNQSCPLNQPNHWLYREKNDGTWSDEITIGVKKDRVDYFCDTRFSPMQVGDDCSSYSLREAAEAPAWLNIKQAKVTPLSGLYSDD